MPDAKTKRRPSHLVARKLLVAAVGVATVNYVGVVACGGKEEGSSSGSSGVPPTSGNLPAPNFDAADNNVPPTSGNLPAPPPDTGVDADDAGDAGDADDDGG